MMHETSTSGRQDRAEIGARIVSYSQDGEPEITEVFAASPSSATNKLTKVVEDRIRELEGGVPVRAVREVVENLIHADYRGVVISILDSGGTVRVSDRGSGIQDKRLALEFGVSGAAPETISEIRGIGAGLGIALAEAKKSGGTLTIEDNLGGGAVVTISSSLEEGEKEIPVEENRFPERRLGEVPNIEISERQQKTLITVLEYGEVGPSNIADIVEVSVSTAYRDLSILEEHGLVESDESGKRVISPLGKDYVEAIISTWVR